MRELIRLVAGYPGPQEFQGQCEAASSDTRLSVVAAFAHKSGNGDEFRTFEDPVLELVGTPVLWWSVVSRIGRSGARVVQLDWSFARGGPWWAGQPGRPLIVARLKGRSICE